MPLFTEARGWQRRQRGFERKRRDSGFPFNLVERLVRFLLAGLEQQVGRFVRAALKHVPQR